MTTEIHDTNGPHADSEEPDQNELEGSLYDIFGLAHLRPGQREVIESVLSGRDTLAVMPTGAGKSLCYQLPALNLPGTAIVVSPLISLMKDQAEKLEEIGADAAQVNSTLNAEQESEALKNIRNADSDVIFVTPERMSDPDFIVDLQTIPINLFVIDEAHCISQWGHDFRPAYLGVGDAIKALGNPTILALTATATPEVIEDITQQLGRPSMHVVNMGIYRPNLNYSVIQITNPDEKLKKLQDLIQKSEGSGIIYTATVKAVEVLAAALAGTDVGIALYHGRLPRKARTESQESFMEGKSRIMIATNAFGWESINRTSASSCTSRCPAPSKHTTRSRAAPVVTVKRPNARCFSMRRTSAYSSFFWSGIIPTRRTCVKCTKRCKTCLRIGRLACPERFLPLEGSAGIL